MGITKVIPIAVLVAFITPSQTSEISVKCILTEITSPDDIIYKFPTTETASVFSLVDTSKTVTLIDKTKGLIKLVKFLKGVLTFGTDNTARINVVLTQSKDGLVLKTVKIELIVLKEGFANPLLSQIIDKVSTLTTLDNIFRRPTARYPFYQKLHRILMQGTAKSKQTSKAECNFRLAIKNLVKLILLKLQVQGDVVTAHVGPQGILSPEKLQELIESTGCIVQIANPICSPETAKYRTIDGTCNNLDRPTDGAAETGFNRFLPALYFDAEGLNEPAGGGVDQPNAPDLPNPSVVTENYIVIQAKSQPNRDGITHMFMQWGQFLDHDMTLAPESENGDVCENIPCNGSPDDFIDPCFPVLPAGGRPCIRLIRSAARCPIDGFALKPREQINVNTAYIDASMVYGSSESVANALRNLTNEFGLLLTSGANLLPIDNSQLGEPLSLCEDQGACFLAGDTRVNEQAALAAMHTLWVREHNRIATELRYINPHWDGERLYQETRRIVGALVQQITYEEWLPIAIGRRSLRRYNRYDPAVSAGISNAFATAAYRLGHSLVRPTFDFLERNFERFPFSPVALKNLFFNNTLAQKVGIDGWMVGLIGNNSQEMDNEMAIGLTDNLFQRDDIDRVGLNLAALNMQRGREHGLPFYSAFLTECQRRFPRLYPIDVSNVTSFDQIKQLFPANTFESIKSVYNNKPQNTDLFPAGIGELPISRRFRRNRQRRRFSDPDPILGPTFTCLLIDQFERLRNGDRFFFRNPGVFTRQQRRAIERTTFSSIICQNIDIVSIPKQAFLNNRKYSCAMQNPISLEPWRDIPPRCQNSFCRNGGSCRRYLFSRRSSFGCFCRLGFTGRFCEKKILVG